MKNCLPLMVCLVLVLSSGKAGAQGCSVCTKTAAQIGEKGARGLNGGIVYLAAIPLAILSTLGIVWYRHQRA